MTQQFYCVHYLTEVRLELGGVIQAVIDLCEAIAADGHRVVLVTLDATDVPSRWQNESGNWPEVVEIPGSRLSKGLIAKKGLEKLNDLLSMADIVHLHTPWAISNLQMARFSRQNNIPYIITVHGMLDDWSMRQRRLKKRAFLVVLARSLFRHATVVHLTAKAERDQACRWVPIADRETIQPLLIDVSARGPLPGQATALRAFPEIIPDKKTILFLSRLHTKKGVELLLGAAAQLWREKQDFQLLIVGPAEPGYLKQLKNLAVELGADEYTKFLGMVHGEEKRSLYQLADVFVLPTYQENFGLVLVEAMACGTPVVTTRGTDIWQELEEAGARIVDLTPQAIATAISDVLADDKARHEMGERGKKYVDQWLDHDHVTAGYVQMYRDAIKKGPRTYSGDFAGKKVPDTKTENRD